MKILIAIIIFSIIIIFHEFGHFILAKRNGILVKEFALGMGPKIFGVQKGETLYSLRLLPFGGFCAMLGKILQMTMRFRKIIKTGHLIQKVYGSESQSLRQDLSLTLFWPMYSPCLL